MNGMSKFLMPVYDNSNKWVINAYASNYKINVYGFLIKSNISKQK